MRAGIGGLPAGEIARALNIPHNTMSSHLSILVNAGLVRSRRDGRSIIYSVDLHGTRELLAFLMQDCCRGRPEVCAPALDNVLLGCGASTDDLGASTGGAEKRAHIAARRPLMSHGDDPRDVLVLCTGNSCRSVLAEALINHLAQGRYRAVSAGSAPAGYVHPKAIETLERHGVRAGSPRSKSWDEFAGRRFDLVITVCDRAANESCPYFAGGYEKLHWSTPDPAAVHGDDRAIDAAFERAFEMLRSRIEAELL